MLESAQAVRSEVWYRSGSLCELKPKIDSLPYSSIVVIFFLSIDNSVIIDTDMALRIDDPSISSYVDNDRSGRIKFIHLFRCHGGPSNVNLFHHDYHIDGSNFTVTELTEEHDCVL